MENMTDAQMEAQFQERNANLKNDISNLVSSATEKTSDMLEAAQQNAETVAAHTMSEPASTEIGHTANQSLMDNIRGDISDMHSTDPNKFGHIVNKTDETFGDKAL
ncbi:hypothetical protein BY458DRAFT_497811 [Sporodiniella umbellata]|nr:hypothetical protein BY458DRAFT_497811 [Sporodiniella umbellata]